MTKPGDRKWKYDILIVYMVEYLNVDCGKLKIYIINSTTPSN